MKNFRQIVFVIFIVVLLIIEMWDDNRSKVKAASPERIERISKTQIDSYISSEIYHDKQTGIEYICFLFEEGGYGGAKPAISCLQTGRTWK
jgi:hypothetical protein